MGVVDGRTWLEILGPSECWELLESRSVGRIGVLHDSAPEIYPVNYAVHGRRIAFRTEVGNKLHGLERSPSVCFEIDDFSADETGWSVLVKGRATEVVDAAERKALDKLPLRLWVVGDKPHWVRIDPVEVTGRRIGRNGGDDRD